MKSYILWFITLLLIPYSNYAQSPVKLWETDALFSGPESVVYDSVRDLLYVSNLRGNKPPDIYYANDFISKITPDGKILNLKWIDGLTDPTGICIFKDKLYIVERFGIVVYDLKKEQIEKRIKIKTSGFLNDITVGADGTVYVSESDTDNIYCIVHDSVTTCYKGEKVSGTNGVLYDKGKLILAVNKDSSIRMIDLKSGDISLMAQLRKGTIDGIRPFGNDYLISFFEGELFRVTKTGKVTEILNTRGQNSNIADFEYVESTKLLIVPALWNNKIVAYRLE